MSGGHTMTVGTGRTQAVVSIRVGHAHAHQLSAVQRPVVRQRGEVGTARQADGAEGIAGQVPLRPLRPGRVIPSLCCCTPSPVRLPLTAITAATRYELRAATGRADLERPRHLRPRAASRRRRRARASAQSDEVASEEEASSASAVEAQPTSPRRAAGGPASPTHPAAARQPHPVDRGITGMGVDLYAGCNSRSRSAARSQERHRVERRDWPDSLVSRSARSRSPQRYSGERPRRPICSTWPALRHQVMVWRHTP